MLIIKWLSRPTVAVQRISTGKISKHSRIRTIRLITVGTHPVVVQL